MSGQSRHGSAFSFSSQGYALLLRCYPSSISASLRGDMQAAFETWLTEVLNRGGAQSLAGLWQAALRDWVVSMAGAYRDQARESRSVRLAVFWLLAISLWMWALMALAGLGNATVGLWLDAHTTFNTALAFAAPSVAFLLSWLSMPKRWMTPNVWLSAQLFRISSVGASAVWALLTYLQLPRLLVGVS